MDSTALTITAEDQRYFGASIRRFSEDGEEFYDAREVAEFFGYRYGPFASIVRHLIIAWEANRRDVDVHIRPVYHITSRGDEVVHSYHLTRRAFLALVMNSNPERRIVALGQRYIVDMVLKSA